MEFAKITTTEMSSQQRSAHIHVRLVRDDNASRGLAFDEDGASYKRFSVSDTSTVRFSKGNLQYNAVMNVWRFAAKQWIYIGEGNANVAQDYNGWIDLFGWGTSGWNSGANAYQPWSTSETDEDYYPGGSYTNNLTGEYANADWGYYNRINNGGNKANQWRTLTNEEWTYLICDDANDIRSDKYGLATIGGKHQGVVLLPDDWVLPSGVTFTFGYGNGYNTNTYTADQWQAMESAGAVFLPTAGEREGSSYNADWGRYWSSSYDSDSNEAFVLDMDFSVDHVQRTSFFRHFAFSVRLVKD